jgi:hypothetical protein
MSDYFDRIEGHLLDAVERHAASRKPRWPMPALGYPRARHAPAVLAAVVVASAIAVAGVFLTSVRSANHASPTSASSVTPSNGVCGVAGANGIYRDGGPRSLLSILGVLRRRQTALDIPPARTLPGILRGGGGLGADAFPVLFQNHLRPSRRIRVISSAVHVYWKYVRLARVSGGLRYYLIPEVAGADVSGTHRCIHPVVSIDMWQINRWDDGGGGGGGTATEILAGDSSSTSSMGSEGTIISFLVPDSVASVTMRFPITTNTPGGRRVMKSVTIKPVGNVVAFKFPANQTGRWRRSVWRSCWTGYPRRVRK